MCWWCLGSPLLVGRRSLSSTVAPPYGVRLDRGEGVEGGDLNSTWVSSVSSFVSNPNVRWVLDANRGTALHFMGLEAAATMGPGLDVLRPPLPGGSCQTQVPIQISGRACSL